MRYSLQSRQTRWADVENMMRMAVALLLCSAAFAAGSARAQNETTPPPAASAPALPTPAPQENAPAGSAPAASPPAEDKAPQASTAETAPPDSAPAEGPPGEGAETRYTFSRVQDGYVRLDNRTGQVLFCGKRSVGWTCQLSPEDRAVFENEIGRLQEENAALKKDMLKRGLPLPSGAKPPPLVQNDRTVLAPDEPRFDRMKVFVEKVWRRLVDLMVSLQKDLLKKS